MTMLETHTESAKGGRSRPDWSKVALDYFDGSLSIRTIGRKHGTTEGGIRKHAARHGWGARRSVTTATGNVDALTRALTVRLAQIDGVGARAGS
jgi:hypothetical protein